jgi:hypothetical protein
LLDFHAIFILLHAIDAAMICAIDAIIFHCRFIFISLIFRLPPLPFRHVFIFIIYYAIFDLILPFIFIIFTLSLFLLVSSFFIAIFIDFHY